MAKKKSSAQSEPEAAAEAKNANPVQPRPDDDPEMKDKIDSSLDNNEDDEKFKGRIDIHTLNYFKRVEKFLEEDSFEDAESKELFINNVLAQVGEGLQTCQLSKHRLTSKILETLLSMCSTAQVISIFKSLLTDVLTISDDRFGSHVMQKIITIIPKHIDRHLVDESLVDEIESMVLQFYKVIKKNAQELIRSVYSCHIISSFVQVLAGIDVSETVSRSRNSRETRTKFFGKKNSARKKTDGKSFGNILNKQLVKVPEIFQKTLHKLAKKIITDDNFGELLCHRNASPVIQTLLLALKEKDPKMCQKLCSLIIEKSKLLEWKGREDNDEGQYNASVPILFADEVGSHVMEKIFYVMSSDLYEELFTRCFSKNLLALCLHPLANYILQHMLANLPNVDMAKQILDELIPFTEDILASGNMGIIVRMAEACLRFKCTQKEFIMALKKSVHLPDTETGKSAFLKLLLTLSTYDVLFEKEDKQENDADKIISATETRNEGNSGQLTKEAINYHGACLVKNLLQFEDPKKLVRCFAKLEDELLLLVKHEYGSFVLEAFLTSSTISKTKKQNFLLKIKKDISTIATDKFGSHVIDKLWSQSSTDEKEIIKEELSKCKSQLRGNMYGRIILRNCGLESFQQQNSLKQEVEDKGENKERLVERSSSKRKATDEDENKAKKKENISNNKRKIEISTDISYQKELKDLGAGVSGVAEIDDVTQNFEGAKKKKTRDEIDELFDEKFAKKANNRVKKNKSKG